MVGLDDKADLLMRQKMQTFFKPHTSNLPTSNGRKGKGIVEEPIYAPPSNFGFVRPAPTSEYVKLASVPTTPMMEKLQATFAEFSS
ncbi:hypothetical protein R1flu_026385 [Riccia fluitans]|uniref:Uncharacterized protein n=1 Tax=Riccia fluitans TaxID=41844 RepID=A0ABD1XFT2_9MARC